MLRFGFLLLCFSELCEQLSISSLNCRSKNSPLLLLGQIHDIGHRSNPLRASRRRGDDNCVALGPQQQQRQAKKSIRRKGCKAKNQPLYTTSSSATTCSTAYLFSHHYFPYSRCCYCHRPAVIAVGVKLLTDVAV